VRGFWERAREAATAMERFKAGLNAFLTLVMVACLLVILADSAWRWFRPPAPGRSDLGAAVPPKLPGA
jgi:hypothetical protein